MVVRGKDWCILRTSGPRTLQLAASLTAASFEVWTPTRTAERRKGRARARVEVPAPITPTFVFARARDVGELVALSSSPISRHPPFSVFRHRDHFPLIADASLQALRDEESRLKHRRLKQVRQAIPAGTSVTMTKGAFAGMTGVVERGNNKEALINFGAGFEVSIATYLLCSDVIQTKNIAA